MKLVPVSNSDDDIEALFRLPLAAFTGARNALATQLKKSGRGDEAARVKALAKPSISAWAVNQLYWNHREAFDKLIVSGERFHKAQTSGKVADMRTALDARREALTHLSDLAASVLREAGHNPAPDTIHRITTTLEGISAYASRDDGPRPGRLTHDVDPPGFESFASFVASGVRSLRSVPPAVPRVSSGRKQRDPRATARSTDLITTNTRRKPGTDKDKRRAEELRKSKIAAAKGSLQDAKRSLTEARARSQRLEAAQKKADAEAKKAEMELRKAKAAAEQAARRARSVAGEFEEAKSALDDAERRVEEASNELESVFQDLS